MKRSENDVEALEHAIRKIQTAIGQDIDLTPVKNRNLRISLARRGDFIGLPRLRTLPFAQRCRPCQEGMERTQAVESRRAPAATVTAEPE